MTADFTPIGPRRTFEGAVEQIAERIRMGELSEGDRLPPEREIAASMEISRPTLREAVRVLASAGVLSVRRGASGGIFVASGYVPFELVRDRSRGRVDRVAGVLQARRMLEPQVARLAAMTAGPAEYEALQACIAAHREMLAGDGAGAGLEDRFLQVDMRFHLWIARATRNETVVSLMRTLLGQLEIARDQALHGHAPLGAWVVDVHERTLAAIRSGDAEAIDTVMDEHLSELERAWDERAGSA